MWVRTNQKDPELRDYIVEHLGSIVIGEAKSVMWGQEHPYGWEQLNTVIDYLAERFEEEGFYGSSNHRTSSVLDIKEKFGSLRVYAVLTNEDKPDYHQILTSTMAKFPGVAPYLEPDFAEEAVVFTGTEKDYQKWMATQPRLEDYI